MNNYNQLKDVLNDIFELNKADLDFGIYRIMNQKRRQVNEFIDKQLPADIKKALSETQSSDKTEIEKELKDLKKKIEDLDGVAETHPKYIAKLEQLKTAENSDVLEQEVFSHLSNFFRRYYKDGDFLSMRRYKKDVYAIPYEGEEVKLHWANHDQYYIKSSENFKNYSFTIPDGRKVTFQLKEVSTEQNNNKIQNDAEHRFAIYAEQPVEESEDELLINFVYEPFPKATKQDALLSEALELLTDKVSGHYASVFALSPTEKNSKRTLLQKHLNDYVAKNSFDYFIHKDLGGFLTRELDFYIKNEVLYLDDINTKQTDFFVAQLSKVKAIKVVAQKVIDFLAQIENFQKKLWLKKKFVIRTDYCITLDRIASTYYPEIAQNQAQLAEWKRLFDVEILNEGQLTFEPFLVLDTKFFNESFKDRLLAEFENLDEQTNGLLINSENFQALNLMQENYQEKVKTIYIDPPYNTGNDGFTYKDGLQSSSWLSLLQNSIFSSSQLMKEDGVFFSSIDDNERNNLEFLLNSIFGLENQVGNITVVNNFKGRSDTKHIATAHEYLLMYQKEDFSTYGVELPKEYENEYKLNDDKGVYRLQGLRKRGTNSRREDRPNMYYPIYLNLKEGRLSISKTTEEDIEILPRLSDGTDGRWRWGKETFNERLDELHYQLVAGRNEYDVFQKDYIGSNGEKKRIKPKSFWHGSEFSSEAGTLQLKNLMGSKDFSTPKSLGLLQYCLQQSTNQLNGGIVLDYFAGSGTTGHATIKLNREDGGKRKYILVEMGTYFNTVTKPRIQKVIYSDNWKNGKPQDKGGISQLVKYQELESYEDTLNNLYLKPITELDFSGKAKEEYMLQYMLEMESREHLFNLGMFRNPFNYQLKVTQNNELKPTPVDLVETFNYLIGLYLSKVQRVKDIKVVEGTTRTGIKTLVIWRDLDTTTHEEVEKLLRRFYDSQRTKEFGQIYINGDHHLENLRSEGDQFKIKLIEETFFKKMFNEVEL